MNRAVRIARQFRELLRIRKRVDAAKRLTERERHERAEQARQESLHGPPLSEWEQDAMYGAVEQERRQAG